MARRRSTRLVFWLAVACGALSIASVAAGAQRASLPDIEDEVMCLQCGTPLNLSTAPVADREREFIRREIARGKSKQEIKDALVDRFGPQVLAVPEDEGFGLAAWVVPGLVVLLALAGVAVAARRWRRSARPVEGPVPLDPAGAQRLESELAAYEGETSGADPPSTRRSLQ
jgi:cytochrome c-type biogenesis protein CcmH